MTTNGYIYMFRDRTTRGVYVEAVDDMEITEDQRLIYCQAVSDIDIVDEKLDQWVEDMGEERDQYDHVKDQIAWMISSLQWIANEHPVQSFHAPKREKQE